MQFSVGNPDPELFPRYTVLPPFVSDPDPAIGFWTLKNLKTFENNFFPVLNSKWLLVFK